MRSINNTNSLIYSMGELYSKGVLSLQEAATKAKVSIYQMMKYIEQKKIRPPSETEEELNNELVRTQALLKSKEKTKVK